MNRPVTMRFSGLLSLLFFIGMGSAFAQPTANFSSNRQTGCEPFSLVVNFSDLSTGGATSWRWFFGDSANSQSIVQNPTFVYSDAGCYTVTLVACNGAQCDTLVRPCFIQIFPQPTPGFFADPIQGCVPFTFSLIDTSSTTSGVLNNWSWTLSNGASGTGPNPTFTISDIGSFGVFLQVTNSLGCSNILQVQDYITTFAAPVVDFTVDVNSSCNPPLTVNLNNTTVLNGAINPSYIWQFPGGVSVAGLDSSTLFNPGPVSYNADGSYDVSLIFSSTNGCRDTVVKPSFIGIGGVTAAFTVSDSVICAGESVVFTNTSVGGVSSLEWNFGTGPGVNGTGQSEVFQFTTPGTYSITLRANNAQCGDTLVRAGFIQVQAVPNANFTASRFADCEPGNPINFTDQSTGAVAWSWDFGDGATSTLQNPTHTFASFDTFQVCLIVTNAQGCNDTLCQDVRIVAPVADFRGGPRRGCVPLVAGFTDVSVSSDVIVSWQWDFGPGGSPSSATTQNVASVTYNSPGNYDVSLIIVTQSGCRDTLTQANFIEVGTPPQLQFTFSEDTVCINESLVFESVFKNPNWDYFWDFQYQAPAGAWVQLTDSLPYAYSDTGTFSVGLLIDNNGCRDSIILTDIIRVGPPRAEFQVSDSVFCSIPDTLFLNNTTLGPADVYDWFVNGVPYFSGQNPPPLPITAVGSYLITLAVENTATGCTDTTTSLIVARNPVANITTNVNFGCRPLAVSLASSGSVPFATGYGWSITSPTAGPILSGSPVPSVVLPDTGNYTVRLIVVDNLNCRDTMIAPNLIRVVGPFAEYDAIPRAGCPGFSASFNDLSVATFGSTISSRLWNFGDPGSGALNTSTLANPSHVYTTLGAYTTSLTVTDNNGCTDTETKVHYIRVTFPAPAFNVADTSTCAGNPVQFNNLSTGFGLTFLWKFGDGATSTATAPTHAYAAPGFYTVTLIATDQNGCVDSLTRTNYIFIEDFTANFGGDPTVGICPPLNTQFADSTIGNVVGWRWDFGTGFNFSNLQNPANVYLAPGTYDVQLIATHEDGCRDTVLKQDFIFLAGPNGSFVIDPPNACLGDTICVTAFTTGATVATFDFRDGNAYTVNTGSAVNDTTSQCHLYQIPGTFSPVIVLQDAQGCVFTLTSPNNTQIFNLPTANFNPTDTIGCTTFAVPFNDLSTIGDSAIVAWDWDFGDGNTSNLQNPVNLFVNPGQYTVTLRVEDINGCEDSVSITAVTAFQGVIADFAASDSFGCAPFTVNFTDQSFNFPSSNWEWDFGDGNSVSGIQNPTHVYANDGVYTVRLVVTDTLGCTDTLIRTDYIRLRHPEARVYASQTLGCNPISITFFGDSTITDTTIVSYEWCLRDLFTGNVVCTTTPTGRDSLTVPFNVPGVFSMTLRVIDPFGCEDISDSVIVTIDERVTPDPLEMRLVTVQNDQTVRVEWEAYPLSDFVEYAVYRLNGPNPGVIATITNQGTTSFVESNPALDCSQNVYCYEVLVQNSCGEFSLPDATQEHCTIELSTATALDAIDLTWTPYVGFPVLVYEVYRVTNYGTPLLTPIATLGGNTLTYTDTVMFCRDSVTYRIQAIGLDPEDRSQSDISRDAPQHNSPTEAVHMVYATVVNNEDIEVQWGSYPGYKPERFVLEKSTDGLAWDSIAGFPLSVNTYLDTAVDVNARTYFYRVFVVDSCGEQSVTGRFAQSIFLEASFLPRTEIPVLNWNAYRQWRNGVLQYNVEVLNDQTGLFELVNPVVGTVTTFQDNLTNLDQPVYCYRIIAEEVGGNNARSTSNEACLIFSPDLYAPNAFSPNGDGNNETFRVYAPNIAEGEMRIFDRWGVEIFFTNNLDLGWDGRYKGADVAEGVYVFTVNAVGLNGDVVTSSGTVTLIR